MKKIMVPCWCEDRVHSFASWPEVRRWVDRVQVGHKDMYARNGEIIGRNISLNS